MMNGSTEHEGSGNFIYINLTSSNFISKKKKKKENELLELI